MYKIFAHQAGILGTVFAVNLFTINDGPGDIIAKNYVTTLPIISFSIAQSFQDQIAARRIPLLYFRNNFIAFSTLTGIYGITKVYDRIKKYK